MFRRKQVVIVNPIIKGEIIMSRGRSYGLGSFLFDIILICLTGGFWLLWIFVREMRRK